MHKLQERPESIGYGQLTGFGGRTAGEMSKFEIWNYPMSNKANI